MRRRTLFSIVGVVAVAGAWLLAGTLAASGATTQYINLSAPAFTGVGESEHNDGNATYPDACAAEVPLQIGDENLGGVINGTGSSIAFLRMTDGHRVTSFSLFANDNADTDVHAYLIRRKIQNDLALPGGYVVMAEAHSADAENNVLRQFTDTSVSFQLVNNRLFSYFIELVNCDGPEPYAVQVVTSNA